MSAIARGGESARDARYFSERLASATLRPEPTGVEVVAFGHRVTIIRDDDRRQTYRIVGEDEADPRVGSISYVSPLARRLERPAFGSTRILRS